MNQIIFLGVLGTALLVVGVTYLIKSWNSRPVLTPEQDAQRIKDGFSPFTYPMAISGVGVFAGVLVLGITFGPFIAH